ncbi:hypothetical protein ROT00_00325 [Agromyces mediolanus]|uniref:hypothetical protein n=1 Tax=Agromyces mediolanus TaxID=41986 RepID=UPI003836C6C9
MVISTVIAVPFGILYLGRVIAAFGESDARGWETVRVSGVGVLALFGVWCLMVLSMGIPKLVGYLRVRSRHPEQGYLVRRPLAFPDSFRAVTGKRLLASMADEFFVVAIAGSRLEFFRLWGPAEPVATLALSDIEEVSIQEVEIHTGYVQAVQLRIAHTHGDAGFEISFLPHRPFPLGTSPMRRDELVGVCAAFRQRIAGAR